MRIFFVSFCGAGGVDAGVEVAAGMMNGARRGWAEELGRYNGPTKRGRPFEQGRSRGKSIQSRSAPGVSLPYNLLKNAMRQPFVVSIRAFSLFIVVRLVLVFFTFDCLEAMLSAIYFEKKLKQE
jgi:hypothetical protein